MNATEKLAYDIKQHLRTKWGVSVTSSEDCGDVVHLIEAAYGTRYFIGKDNSGHKYLVQCEHRDEWNAWSELPDDDERGWTVPDYAKRFDGYLTFAMPETELRK